MYILPACTGFSIINANAEKRKVSKGNAFREPHKLKRGGGNFTEDGLGAAMPNGGESPLGTTGFARYSGKPCILRR